MKNLILFLISVLIFCIEGNAQSPQFAVVRPNGTTQIFQSWTTAYNAAVNDDFIYLPGTGISGDLIINKRLHIYGAGHHPDSTIATSKTIVTNSIQFYHGASGGSIEGIFNLGSFYVGNNGSKVVNYTISRCYVSNNINLGAAPGDSMPEYITISECIVSSLSAASSSGSYSHNCTFEKNIILGSIGYFQYCQFKNNIFLTTGPCGSYINNCIIENNIFLYSNPLQASTNCFNSFYNNLKIGYADYEESGACPILAENGNISVPNYTDIFISYDNNGFDYGDNYHLNPSCPGVGAGTDGTDIGIYGTINPTSEGWVPSNPHIYFKDIDPTTGADGKLHIQVGVRTNN